MRFFLIATAIPHIAANGLYRTQWKCSHCVTPTTSPSSIQPIVNKNKSQLQVAQCLRIQEFHLVQYCRGAMNNKGAWSFSCRRGLLAYVYSGVSLTMNVLNALVAGNGSYIVRPCGHDLHGPTSPFVRQN